MSNAKRNLLLAGAATVTLLMAAIGFASAQDDETSTTSDSATDDGADDGATRAKDRDCPGHAKAGDDAEGAAEVAAEA